MQPPEPKKTNKKPKLVPCPNCKTMAEFSPNNAFRPFCSERCKLIDLGDWANERHAIPEKTPTQDLDDME